ncbi:MAG: septum formation initiator family protein [Oscillospiraceae bacterium]|nr:septum formation initiator family protein [Oscillospiraceae bacterium]
MKKYKKRSHSFILTLALVAMIGYFVITLIQMQVKIKEKEEMAQLTNKEYEAQLLENEELMNILNEDDEAKYIERVARDVLGYVYPGERVYYDTASGQ